MSRRNTKLTAAALVLFAALTSAATRWVAEVSSSRLAFTGTQAGAAFEGRFERYDAHIRFDPSDLAASRFEVVVDTASVDTQDDERDQIIRSPDLFAVEEYPQATYVADRFEVASGGFIAHGRLTLRNVTRELPVEFSFDRDESGAILRGSATLSRLAFDVGQGEWHDTEWVGDEVHVSFELRLSREPQSAPAGG